MKFLALTIFAITNVFSGVAFAGKADADKDYYRSEPQDSKKPQKRLATIPVAYRTGLYGGKSEQAIPGNTQGNQIEKYKVNIQTQGRSETDHRSPAGQR